MKQLSFLAGISLVLMSSTLFAATSLDSNWICTTNASSSEVAADKAADKQSADSARSAADAFAAASTNCRDCTQITCEVKTK